MPNIKYVVALTLALLLFVTVRAHAGVTNENVFLGTSTDAAFSVHPADGVYFVPQYMNGYPTAATIWPRVVTVDCVEVVDADKQSNLKCEGYNWSPKMGRGEYLYFQPIVHKAPVPVIIYKEVLVKKKAE